jgi:hypothetical protein
MRSHEFPYSVEHQLSPAQTVDGNRPVVSIALVVLAAFAVGLIPVTYYLATGSTPASSTQAGIWESLGQQD